MGWIWSWSGGREEDSRVSEPYGGRRSRREKRDRGIGVQWEDVCEVVGHWEGGGVENGHEWDGSGETGPGKEGPQEDG